MTTIANKKPYCIVVGLDFSEQSSNVLASALDLARRFDRAVVRVVYAITLTPVEGIPVPVEELSTDARIRFDAMLAEMHPDSPVGLEILEGAAAEMVCHVALELHADVVVLGTHGRRGLSRVMFGSVAEAIVRRAPCSVWVVRERVTTAEERIEAPCGECTAARQQNGNPLTVCARHKDHHARAHTYRESSPGQDFAVGSQSFRSPTV